MNCNLKKKINRNAETADLNRLKWYVLNMVPFSCSNVNKSKTSKGEKTQYFTVEVSM